MGNCFWGHPQLSRRRQTAENNKKRQMRPLRQTLHRAMVETDEKTLKQKKMFSKNL